MPVRRPARSRALLVVSLCALFACKSPATAQKTAADAARPAPSSAAPAAPPAAGAPARDGGPGASRSPAAAAPDVPARADEEAPGAAIIATLGETAVIALPAPGFDQLPRDQRLLAYWLGRAGSAGDAIAYEQSYRHNLPIVRLLRGILTHAQAVPAEVLPPLREYARALYLHHGVHDDLTGRKVVPRLRPAELRAAALAARAAGGDLGLSPGASLEAFLRELEGPVFDPAQDALRTDKAPANGGDPLRASAVNFYEGVGLKDLATFRDRFPLNSRLVKEDGRLVEQVYRAGQPQGRGRKGAQAEPAVPAGLAAERLARSGAALEQAMQLAGGAQLRGLRELAAYLRTGEPDRFRASQREWLKEATPVDYILGFVETYADPRGQKALWEGFVGYQDAPRTETVRRLAAAAQYFEDAKPWPAAYKRQGIAVPAAAALWLAAGSGDNRPQSFAGVNLPNENAEREKFGSKSFLLPGYDDAVAQVRSAALTREFAPPALADALVRCRSQQRFALVAFHEIVGHASGRVSSALADARLDPADVLQEGYNTLEEARADLVGHWHAGDPRTKEIGLLPDSRCQDLYPQYATTEWLLSLANVPEGDRVEEDHLRGDQLMTWWFTSKGAIAAQTLGGKRYLVVADAARWRAAAGELLALLQDLKARGDRAQLKALLDAHASRLDPGLRDEVIGRIRSLRVPRRVLALSPVLRPVLADGVAVDATAEPVRDLDAQILADWAGF
ncbi:MAG: dihydrofolate reductase [Myxococcales bacterium]